MTKRCSVPCRVNRTPAFTLVEVLVVLVLISILSSMVLTAVNGVTNSARQARTRSIIATIDSVIQEQYESYKYRPLPVVVPDTSALDNPDNDSVFAYEIMPSEAARVRLNMVRDLQRMEMPDRASDIVFATGDVNSPASLTAAVSRVIRQDGKMVRELDPSGRSPAGVPWNAASRFDQYRRRLMSRTRINLEHDSAECLYMIMATSFVAGVPAISSIPSSNIGDVDEDGLPEILDGWGQPIGFIRWPVGYQAAVDDGSVTFIEPDEFDLMRSDFGWIINGPTPEANIPSPWSIRPLVISSGPDREFGVRFGPEDSAGSPVLLRYSPTFPAGAPGIRMVWRPDEAHMGPERHGRINAVIQQYFFVDPFFRNRELFAGVNLPGSSRGPSSFQDDNITNYQSAVSE